MSDHAAAESLAIVDVEINLGDRKLCTKMSVPATPMRLMELLPILQQVANAVVDSGVADAEAAGHTIACQKGCGACCRQLVPISEVEARRIRDLVDEMPEPRRSHVRQRFDEARQKLAAGRPVGEVAGSGRLDRRNLSGNGNALFLSRYSLPIFRGRIVLDPSRPSVDVPGIPGYFTAGQLRDPKKRQHRQSGDARSGLDGPGTFRPERSRGQIHSLGAAGDGSGVGRLTS